MFRLLLLITMIYQVLGCPYACMAGLPSTAGDSRAVGCRCCDHKRCAESSLPTEEQDESGTACFCHSPVIAATVTQLNQDIFSSQIWTIVESPSQPAVVFASIVSNEHWPLADKSGMGLRIVVQSFLL